MDNYAIADQLSMLAKLMDIHGENSFKSKSYSIAAFTIEKLPEEVATLSPQKIAGIKGIGDSVGKKIVELIESGELKALKEILAKTPSGILDLLSIKGLGPKKINSLWKEHNISTIEDLKQACRENKLAEKKGFGDKTQEKILSEIHFQEQNEGKYLYAQIEAFADAFTLKIKEAFPNQLIEISGEFKRQLEVIEKLEWVTIIPKEDLKNYLTKSSLILASESDDLLIMNAENSISLHFYIVPQNQFYYKLVETSSSKEFFMSLQSIIKTDAAANAEEEVFSSSGLKYVPAFLRERTFDATRSIDADSLIQTSDIKGLIHSHSNWSDGAYTIEQMAKALIDLGMEYMVISDHSKAAYYANGLTEERIKEQHKYIDELNQKFAPFKIFKSIECDILNDGSMDYSNGVLSTFDLVIASIHSNLDMDEEKAMRRLLGAITNPYVTILGHMTGRILLRRRGYPVNYQTIIDACSANNVVIEINASPSRLDIDWRWVDNALEKGLMLSVNPDAHTIEEFPNIKYGVLVGQKGGLTKERNLSSFSLSEFENFLQENKKLKGISH